jgi:hypothetical protein
LLGFSDDAGLNDVQHNKGETDTLLQSTGGVMRHISTQRSASEDFAFAWPVVHWAESWLR